MRLRFVFWDIDGTLLTTGRAGIFAWERALLEEFDIALDLSEVRTAGLTDTEIALSLARRVREGATDEQISSMLARYGGHLPSCLPLRQGAVLPGVVPVLERLERETDVRSYLLTGNTQAGAEAKLSHYGLGQYFAGGVFADGCLDRVEIATRAARLAAAEASGGEARCFVVGDTPHDIRCGKAIGARTIAVATGEFTVEELRVHEPWVALPRLPAPDGFLQLLESE
jgi:phosphoglycolate phosphatase-like HAD superfamily hydrolase